MVSNYCVIIFVVGVVEQIALTSGVEMEVFKGRCSTMSLMNVAEVPVIRNARNKLLPN